MLVRERFHSEAKTHKLSITYKYLLFATYQKNTVYPHNTLLKTNQAFISKQKQIRVHFQYRQPDSER